MTDALRGACVPGDLVLLGRLVANLIDNAVGTIRPGGWIQVATGAGRAERPPGRGQRRACRIPPDAVGPLFEPFRRLGGRAGAADRGTGLGLSIVASVAIAHHGTATARGAACGLEVTVALPARPS